MSGSVVPCKCCGRQTWTNVNADVCGDCADDLRNEEAAEEWETRIANEELEAFADYERQLEDLNATRPD